MKSKKDVIDFYEKNRRWLELLVSNTEYPRVLRAAAGAVIEIALEEGMRGRN